MAKFLHDRAKAAGEAEDATIIDQLIARVTDLAAKVVAYVSQRYVDELKKENKFSLENQKEAFKMAYDYLISMISDEAQVLIGAVFGDFQMWLTALIEAAVRKQQETPVVVAVSDAPVALNVETSDDVDANQVVRMMGFGND